MRRIFAALAALAMGASAASAKPEAVSVSYQVNNRHDGVQKFGKTFKPPLKVLWQAHITNDITDVISYPVIADHRAFVTVDLAGFSSTTVFALDLDTGRVLWKKKVKSGQPISHLAYDNGRVFFVNFDGLVEAFAPADGKVLWQHQFHEQSPVFFNPPIAADGLVYVSGTDFGDKLHALDEATGNEVWWQWLSSAGGGISAPVYDGKALYTSFNCSTEKLNPKTGAVLWNQNIDFYPYGMTAVVFDDRLYVRDFHCVGDYKRDTKKGEVAGYFNSALAPAFWKDKHGAALEYATRDGALVAVDPETNAKIWQLDIPWPVGMPPLVIDDRLFVTDEVGDVYLADARTGKIKWQTHIEDAYEPSNEWQFAVPLKGVGAGDNTIVVPGRLYLTALAPASDPRFKRGK